MPIAPLLLTLAAGLSTVIGGCIALGRSSPSAAFHARALGFAAGVMLYLSFFDLFPLGLSLLTGPRAELIAVLCLLGGFSLLFLLDHPKKRQDRDTGTQTMRRLGLVSAISVLLHNLPEGIATFTTASASLSIGIPVAIAIALHNIPEGIAIAAPLRRAGKSRLYALGWTAISGLSEPIGGVIGYLLLRPFLSDTLFGVLYTGVAGVMIALSLLLLLPASAALASPRLGAKYSLIGMGVIALALIVLG